MLPQILIAPPAAFAMKFYCENGCCARKFITPIQPTESELRQKDNEQAAIHCCRVLR